MIKVDVLKEDNNQPSLWYNFIQNIRKFDKKSANDNLHINSILSKFNAKNIVASNYVEFETEEDFLAFKLTWCGNND